MDFPTRKEPGLMDKFAAALRQFSPFRPSPAEQAEMKLIRDEFAALGKSEPSTLPDETVLFLALDVKAPNRNDSKWTRACVAADIEALPAEEKEDGITAENLGIHVRFLLRDVQEDHIPAILSARRGQFIECTGRYGGPLGDDFYAKSMVVRKDLGVVPGRELPSDDNVFDVITAAFADEVPTLHFTPTGMR